MDDKTSGFRLGTRASVSACGIHLRACLIALLLFSAVGCAREMVPPRKAQNLEALLPELPGSLRMAVIGDSGTGTPAQYQVGQQMAAFHGMFPFETVLMLGDNVYGSKTPADFELKFRRPYAALLAAGVKFHASLGNHDDASELTYEPFHMNAERYYVFSGMEGRARFYALDSNRMDGTQVEWLERELRSDPSDWKIAFFHHPLYSSGGRHGSTAALRAVLEPLFVKYGVDVVFSGHDHFYERIRPQKEIVYFVSGAAGALSIADIERSSLTAKGFARDNHFLLVEITGDDLYYQAVSRTGETLDYGVFRRREALQTPPQPPPTETRASEGDPEGRSIP